MQQEDHAEQDEHDRAHWNLAGFDLGSAPKGGRQTVRIRSGQTGLNGTRRAHRVNNLVDDEERDSDAADRWQHIARSVTTRYQQSKNAQVRQALGVLPVVHGPDTKWNRT